MVTIYRAAAWKIAIYGGDHGAPHFHIEGPDFRCSISIETLDIIVGRAPRKVLLDALGWAAMNKDLLRQIWKDLN